jgi:hypothetical protein
MNIAQSQVLFKQGLCEYQLGLVDYSDRDHVILRHSGDYPDRGHAILRQSQVTILTETVLHILRQSQVTIFLTTETMLF